MTLSNRRRSRKTGMSPGALIHIGERKTDTPHLEVFAYSEQSLVERQPVTLQEAMVLKTPDACFWLNLDGLHDTNLMEELGRKFSIHSLALEDILNTSQRPKLETFDQHLFTVLRMVTLDAHQQIQTEQLSLIIGEHTLLSFQEKPGDVFEPLRNRLRSGKGRLRKSSSDYLAYALIDAVVDNYFPVLEKLGESLEELEDTVITAPSPETLKQIHTLKRDLIYLRRQIWPLRELLSGLIKGESAMVTPATVIFLRDVYDHTIQIMDTIESYRDLAAGILDLYLSSTSQRLNEIMKVLTMIATIFIPLTFLAGVYGMNFEFMPELTWRFGYFVILGLMILITLIMLLFFRRKKWL